MILVKILIIVLLVITLRMFLLQKTLVLTKRLTALVIFCCLVLLVIFPDGSTNISQMFGIGRGVDLIFYFSHLFLLLLIVSQWRRNVQLSDKITKLSRHIALSKAETPKENQTGSTSE